MKDFVEQDVKDYFATRESFDELLELMVKYDVFTHIKTGDGQDGFDFSNNFREYFKACDKKAKSINFKGTQVEFYISTLMSWNISFSLAKQMANIIGGRIEEEQRRMKITKINRGNPQQ